MPRSNRSRRPRRAPRSEPGQGIDRDRALFGTARTERRRGADWIVRPVSAADAVKAYRCPGCNQDIRPATAHVVAWPAEEPIGAFGGVQDRRHWHRACWDADRRR